MPLLPAFCNNCNIIFPSPIFIGEGSTNNIVTGNIVKCNKCGADAYIPDGIYNTINNLIEVVQAADLTHEKLKIYNNFFKKLKNANYEDVKSNLEEKAPELNKLIDILPKTRNELYLFLGILISIFSLILNSVSEKPTINITNIMNEYNSYNSLNITQNRTDTKKQKLKLRRNEKCFCGSELKFKYCHGKN
ncbi:hypothetical protein BH23BAC1_BH23BAC1_41520 [soil metagenome]